MLLLENANLESDSHGVLFRDSSSKDDFDAHIFKMFDAGTVLFHLIWVVKNANRLNTEVVHRRDLFDGIEVLNKHITIRKVIANLSHSLVPDGGDRKDVRESIDEHHKSDVGRVSPSHCLFDATLEEENGAGNTEKYDEDHSEIEVFLEQVVLLFFILFDVLTTYNISSCRVGTDTNDKGECVSVLDL